MAVSVLIGQASLTGVKGTFVSPNQGLQGLIISNESPYTVTINLQGTSVTKNLLPETVDFFPVYQGFNGNITYNPTTYVTNPSSYTQAMLFFETVGLNEQFNANQYPISLSRTAVTATASGKPLFTTKYAVSGTAHKTQWLNVFNPLTSGVNYYFYSLPVFTDDSTQPTAFVTLIYNNGNNLSLPNPVSAFSHTGAASPPTSTASCSSDDSDTNYASGFQSVDGMHIQQYITQDLLNFPDQLILEPGCNLLLNLASGSINHTVRLTAKYSEGQ